MKSPPPKTSGRASKPARAARKAANESGLRVAEPVPGYLVAPLMGGLAATMNMLPHAHLAEILEVSPKTLTRWIKTGERLSPQQTDRMARLETLFKHGEHVLGSRESVQRWLHAKVLYLDGKRPIELLKTESGREQVDEALGVIEWGMF
jgi:putative toxin-antitoxin system antitoxin component (TIGR02293 family)